MTPRQLQRTAGLFLVAIPVVFTVCFTLLPTNRVPRWVMEKVGFDYEREMTHAGSPHVLHRNTTGR